MTTNRPRLPYAQVVFNLPLERTFTYGIPENMADRIDRGSRVTADFNHRRLCGAVVRLTDTIDFPANRLKPLQKLLDERPLITDPMFALADWLRDYYLCSLGEAIFVQVPTAKRETAVPTAGDAVTPPAVDLTTEQHAALDRLTASIDRGAVNTHLLYGVTGSGKTEVYLRAARHCLELGRQTILLVPEISLTPQTIRYFRERLPCRIATIHSKLTASEKLYLFRRMQQGEIDIVIGARSAVFSPLPRIGMIVIDEEHESSYKQGETPRYHARQVAMKRCGVHNATLVLASATPSLESYYFGTQGRFLLSPLPTRIGADMAKTQVIDLASATKVSSQPFLSEEILRETDTVLARGEQVIFFLNKRGFSSCLLCRECGAVSECPSCNVSLTYHRGQEGKQDYLLCHYCNHRSGVPAICPDCGNRSLKRIGAGTQQIEEIIRSRFPDYTAVRLDQDSTRRKHVFSETLEKFRQKEIHILIGTQMIAKGLHFPDVTLVGVINADISLHLPDYRSGERTFSLLTQVAGRSGRGLKHGKVIIQTFHPDHYVMHHALNQDYPAFYAEEIKRRREHGFPPFGRFLRLVVRGAREDSVRKQAGRLAEAIRPLLGDQGQVFSSPAVLDRIKEHYRWQVVLDAASNPLLRRTVAEVKRRDLWTADKSLYIEIDVDPVNML